MMPAILRPALLATTLGLLAMAATAAADDWERDRRLTFDPAASRTSINFARSTAVDNRGRVHVVWEDSRDGETQIYYKRSRAGGALWGGDRRLSTRGVDCQQPAIAALGSDVYVVWHQNGGATRGVHLRSSSDGGRSWGPRKAISAPGQAAAHASVAATGSAVHVLWMAPEGVHAEVFTRRSLDGGESWEEIRGISSTPFDSWVPSLAVDGDRVFVAWVDYRDGNEEEYLRISEDAGATWQEPLRLTEDLADSWAPTVAISGQTVHLAWFDRRAAGISDAEVEGALNEALELIGLPASPPPRRDPAVYYLPEFQRRLEEKKRQVLAVGPVWVAAGGDLGELDRRIRRFERLYRRWAHGWEIYTKRSDDGGLSWNEDRRLTNAPQPSQRPSIAADGDEVHVVWFDLRGDAEEIYHKESRDGGRTWGGDQRLTRAAGISRYPTVALSEEWVHVVWTDGRNGNEEIYTKRKRR